MQDGKTPNQGRHIPPRPEVLIVVGPGGVVEVYTSRHIPITVAQKLQGLPDTADAELYAEEYLERSLPQWAKEIYLPGNMQTTKTIRLRTPSQDMERRVNLALVRKAAHLHEEDGKDVQANAKDDTQGTGEAAPRPGEKPAEATPPQTSNQANGQKTHPKGSHAV